MEAWVNDEKGQDPFYSKSPTWHKESVVEGTLDY